MITIKTTHYGQDYATIEISNGSEKHEIETTIGMGEAIDRMNAQTELVKEKVHKTEIHEITWNGKTYFKVYAENMNGRMILATKTKFEDVKKAREYTRTMFPTFDLVKKVRKVQF